MLTSYLKFLSVIFLGGALLAACGNANNSIENVSAQSGADVKPISASTPKATQNEQTAVFAGGCYWGTEAVFEHVKGVSDVTSGFSIGTAQPSAGTNTASAGAAEAVKITYDPSKVSYEQLLKIFFLVAHDPTELNRQGPDIGAEYRSAIFYVSDEQRELSEKYIAELNQEKTFASPIVTEIAALETFQKAPDEHQDYMARHLNDAYIVINDKPKLENLQAQFPDFYVSK